MQDVPEKNPIEVRPESGQWVVARQGSSRALSKHPTQKEAEPVGRERARKDKVEFILKGRDGQIGKKDSYGPDPRRSKGKPAPPAASRYPGIITIIPGLTRPGPNRDLARRRPPGGARSSRRPACRRSTAQYHP